MESLLLKKISFLKIQFIGILILIFSNVFAGGNFSLTTGYGNYSLVNIGTQWNFSEKSSLSVFYGSNLNINNISSWSTGISYEMVAKQSVVKWRIKPGFSLGSIYWIQDDDLYYFETISFPLMALFEYPISPKMKVRAEGGGIYNSVLTSDRKQNVEAGYPTRFNGIYRISLIYKLGKK